MPEGDTVWRTARRLHGALAGAELLRSDLRVPQLATADLSGRRVLEVPARGKHLLTRLEGGLTLRTHLGMEGAWRVYASGRRWTGGPGHEIRAVLATGREAAVGYRLREVELLRTADEERVLGHLGPDLLGPDWDPAEAERRLRADPGRPLGEALLDQRNLAGIGNVYRSELCFLGRVPPWIPVGDLPHGPPGGPSPLGRLLVLAQRLLEANKDHDDRSTTGERRPGRLLWVYGRRNQPCRRCGTPVRTAETGPRQALRVVYWCPACQRTS